MFAKDLGKSFAMASRIRVRVIGRVWARKIKPTGLLGKAAAILKKLSKPWEVTGPTASAEFLEALPLALEYRKFAPASHPVRAIVEHTTPDRIYKIDYFPNDRRRHSVVTEKAVQPAAMVVVVSSAAKGLLPLPVTPGKLWIMGKACRLDDTPGGGYTK